MNEQDVRVTVYDNLMPPPHNQYIVKLLHEPTGTVHTEYGVQGESRLQVKRRAWEKLERELDHA